MNMNAVLAVIAAALMLAGCATTTPADSSDQATSVAAQSNGGQANNKASATKVSAPNPAKQELDDFNQKLMTAAGKHPAQQSDYQYRLGPGDVLTINADQVDELQNVQARISGDGTVTLPLLGDVKIAGLTTNQAEKVIARRLGQYVYNPQVSLFINDYRSQEVTVTGAVNKPGIFNINRPRTLLDMLSVAGGLTDNASYTVSVQTEQTDPKTGHLKHALLVVDCVSW